MCVLYNTFKTTHTQTTHRRSSSQCRGNPLRPTNSDEQLHVSFSLVLEDESYSTGPETTERNEAEHRSLPTRSMSPWNMVQNHNPHRYPEYLEEAECDCQTCGIGLCEKIYYRMPVLWRSNHCDRHGRYKYRTGWQDLVVGCTCAMPRISGNFLFG